MDVKLNSSPVSSSMPAAATAQRWPLIYWVKPIFATADAVERHRGCGIGRSIWLRPAQTALRMLPEVVGPLAPGVARRRSGDADARCAPAPTKSQSARSYRQGRADHPFMSVGSPLAGAPWWSGPVRPVRRWLPIWSGDIVQSNSWSAEAVKGVDRAAEVAALLREGGAQVAVGLLWRLDRDALAALLAGAWIRAIRLKGCFMPRCWTM